MGEPLVSAVILTYNQEKYIEQTIECALAQKIDFEYEIIIGEDCSTDSTREICLQYQKKYPDIIRVITSDKNVGLMDNWYRSVKAARGKYIAGCGGDDYWHDSEKIREQVHVLENNSCYGMVHSDFDCYHQNSGKTIKNYMRRKNYKHNEVKNNQLEMLISQKTPIKASTVMFRKNIFEKFYDKKLFDEKKFMMEDTPFYIEVAANYKIFYINKSFVTYRKMAESLTKSENKFKSLHFWISDSEMYLYFCEKYKIIDSIKKYHKKNLLKRNLQLAFYSKNITLANNVVSNNENLSAKDKLWYLGTKYCLLGKLITIYDKYLRIPRG
jgi:glycosyltransferase involved in cell wall biosynthesis